MAAVILNDDDDLGEDGNLEATKLETPAAPAPAPVQDKPRKFAGKTPEQIEAAYEELEKRFGKQGEEVGELRKLSDQLIRSTLENPKRAAAPSTTEPTAQPLDDSAFFLDPLGTIKKVLEQDETIKELRTRNTETQQERARRITVEKHPDCDALAEDPGFQAWVTKSKIRHSLWGAACKFDAEAADELFSTYKALNPSKAEAQAPTTAVVEDKSVVDAQRKAAGAATGTTGSGETGKGKPVFSRRKLMDLKITNPEEYDARSDEILRAYAEGRVKP